MVDHRVVLLVVTIVMVVFILVGHSVVVLDDIVVLHRVIVLDDIVVLHGVMVINDALVDDWVSVDNFVLVDVLHLANVMVHIVVVLLVVRVDLLDEHVVGEVVEWLVLDVVLLDHMVVVVVVMLSHRRRLVIDLGVVMHVRCRVVRRRLHAVVAVLVVHDGLMVHAVVVVDQVLFEVVLGIGLLVNELMVVVVMVVIVVHGRMLVVIVVMAVMVLESYLVVVGVVLVPVVVVHTVAMVVLRVQVALVFVVNRVMVLFIVVLEASVLAVMHVALVVEIVQLWTVVRVVVIWVRVFNMRLMVVDSLAVVRVLVEVDRLVIDVLVLLDDDIASMAVLLVLSILNLVRQEVLSHVGVGKAHALCVSRHQVTVKLARELVIVAVRMSAALGVVLAILVMELLPLLHLVVSVVEWVRCHRWQLLSRVEDVLRVLGLHVVCDIEQWALSVIRVHWHTLSSVRWLEVPATVNASRRPVLAAVIELSRAVGVLMAGHVETLTKPSNLHERRVWSVELVASIVVGAGDGGSEG